MRRSRRVVVVLAACAAVFAVTSTAGAGSRTHTVRSCGSVHVTYGRNVVYPWHEGCATAKRIVRAATSSHVKVVVNFTGSGALTGNSAVVRILGQDWVCGGQMGFYWCGYPYRPATVGGYTTFKGPFTRYVAYDACRLTGGACPRTVSVDSERATTDGW